MNSPVFFSHFREKVVVNGKVVKDVEVEKTNVPPLQNPSPLYVIRKTNYPRRRKHVHFSQLPDSVMVYKIQRNHHRSTKKKARFMKNRLNKTSKSRINANRKRAK